MTKSPRLLGMTASLIRDLPRSRSVGVHHPDLHAPTAIALERDPAIGKERRRFIQVWLLVPRELRRRAARDVEHPDVRRVLRARLGIVLASLHRDAAAVRRPRRPLRTTVYRRVEAAELARTRSVRAHQPD